MLPDILYILTHIDKMLPLFTQTYGFYTYFLLFTVIFFETGVVLTFFIPGESLLIVSGLVASEQILNIEWLIPIFVVAAILGGIFNYWIGARIGFDAIHQKFPYLITKEHIVRTYDFFSKYGSETIFFGRFIPYLRTFVPFLAGIVSMNYPRFSCYNIISAIAWVSVFTFGGYFLAKIPFIRDNLSLIVMGFAIFMAASFIFFIKGIMNANAAVTQ